MALISCPECEKEISDKARFCPHCGYPIFSTDTFDSKAIETSEAQVDLNTSIAYVDEVQQTNQQCEDSNIDNDISNKTSDTKQRFRKKPIIIISVVIILIFTIIFIPKINTHFQYLNAVKDSVSRVMSSGYAQSSYKKIEFSKDIFNDKFDITGYKILKQEQIHTNYDIIIYSITIFSDNDSILDEEINNVYEAITAAIDKNFDDNYNFFYKNRRILFPFIDLTIKTPTDNYTKEYNLSYYFNSNSNYPSDNDKGSYLTAAKNEVKNILKSPSSAKFPWSFDEYTFSKNGDTVTIKGYVDAENSFGAMLRQNFTVVINVNSDKYTLESISID